MLHLLRCDRVTLSDTAEAAEGGKKEKERETDRDAEEEK